MTSEHIKEQVKLEIAAKQKEAKGGEGSEQAGGKSALDPAADEQQKVREEDEMIFPILYEVLPAAFQKLKQNAALPSSECKKSSNSAGVAAPGNSPSTPKRGHAEAKARNSGFAAAGEQDGSVLGAASTPHTQLKLSHSGSLVAELGAKSPTGAGGNKAESGRGGAKAGASMPTWSTVSTAATISTAPTAATTVYSDGTAISSEGGAGAAPAAAAAGLAGQQGQQQGQQQGRLGVAGPPTGGGAAGAAAREDIRVRVNYEDVVKEILPLRLKEGKKAGMVKKCIHFLKKYNPKPRYKCRNAFISVHPHTIQVLSIIEGESPLHVEKVNCDRYKYTNINFNTK